MHMHPNTTRRATRIIARSTAVAGVAALAAGLAGCGSVQSLLGGPERDEETNQVVEEGTESVFDMQVGDCLNEPGAEDQITDVTIVPCSEPHDYEYYFEGDVSDLGEEWPGEDAIGEAGDEVCYGAFEDFIGTPYEESEIYYQFYWPSEQGWEQGDHVINCLVFEVEDMATGAPKQIEGSLADAQR